MLLLHTQQRATLIQVGCVVSGPCCYLCICVKIQPAMTQAVSCCSLLTDLCSTSITAVAFPKQTSCQTSGQNLAIIFTSLSVLTHSLQ